MRPDLADVGMALRDQASLSVLTARSGAPAATTAASLYKSAKSAKASATAPSRAALRRRFAASLTRRSGPPPGDPSASSNDARYDRSHAAPTSSARATMPSPAACRSSKEPSKPNPALTTSSLKPFNSSSSAYLSASPTLPPPSAAASRASPSACPRFAKKEEISSRGTGSKRTDCAREATVGSTPSRDAARRIKTTAPSGSSSVFKRAFAA